MIQSNGNYNSLFGTILLNGSNTVEDKKSEENLFKSNIISLMFIALQWYPCDISLNRFTFWLLFYFFSNRNRYIHVQCAVCIHISLSSPSKSDSSFSFYSFFACSFIHCHSVRFFGICFASQ